MTSAENIEELLDQIQNQTGIRFSITDSQIDDEELLITLKNMLRAGHSSTSKEGFLRGLLLGLLSDQEIPPLSSGKERLLFPGPHGDQTTDLIHGAVYLCPVLLLRCGYSDPDR